MAGANAGIIGGADMQKALATCHYWFIRWRSDVSFSLCIDCFNQDVFYASFVDYGCKWSMPVSLLMFLTVSGAPGDAFRELLYDILFADNVDVEEENPLNLFHLAISGYDWKHLHTTSLINYPNPFQLDKWLLLQRDGAVHYLVRVALFNILDCYRDS